MAEDRVALVLPSREATEAERLDLDETERRLAGRGIACDRIEASHLDSSSGTLVLGSIAAVPAVRTLSRPWVLNAARIPDGFSPADLEGCRYVSVPTRADRRRLAGRSLPVAIVPSLLSSLAKEAAAPPERRDVVGIHLDAAAERAHPGWHEPFRRWDRWEKVFVPFASTAADRAALVRLMRAVGSGRSTGALSPAEAFRRIGALRLFVTCSLPAALLAYLQNVPFLLHPSEPGAEDYLRDRGLGSWVFRTPDELARKARQLLEASPDYTALVSRDVVATERHVDLLERAVRGPGDVAVPRELAEPDFGAPSFRFDGAAPAGADPEPDRTDERLRDFLTRLGAEIDRLHAEIASQCRRIDELAAEIDRLQHEVVDELHGELARRDALIDEMRGSRAWRFASRVQELNARLRRMRARVLPS